LKSSTPVAISIEALTQQENALAVTRIMGFAPTYNRGKKISVLMTLDVTNE
jgi:hypothetical protein